MPALADGDLGRAVGLMFEEAERCYHELGLGGWRDSSNPLVSTRPCARPVVANTGAAGHVHRLPLRHLLRRSPEHLLYRSAYFEAVRQAPGFKGHIAHVGWPWYDEGVAVMSMTIGVFGNDPKDWDLRCDLSFGAPNDWQHPIHPSAWNRQFRKGCSAKFV